MQPEAIKKAKAEAKRFLEAVKAYETEHAKTYESGICNYGLGVFDRCLTCFAVYNFYEPVLRTRSTTP